MKIKKIALKNFRQYKDIELNFTNPKSSYDLNYIRAENGIGKTTLLNAITWCLYNSEKHITKKLEDQTLPKLTLDTLRKMNTDDKEDTSVSITLSSDSEEVTFRRFITFRKNEENIAYPIKPGQEVTITPIVGETDYSDKEDVFNAEVSKRLPEKIQQFFFFDGEQLDNYLEGNTGTDVEDSVLGISQIDLLTSMSTRLETISTEMRRELAKNVPVLSNLNEELELKKKRVNDLKIQIKKQQEEQRKAKDEIIDLTATLKNQPDIAKLEEERVQYKQERDTTEIELKKVTDEMRKKLREYVFLLHALPRIRKFYNLIKEKEANNELPPVFDKEILESMLTSHHCAFCDRDLDNHSVDFINDLLHRYEINHSTGTLLTKAVGALENAIIKAKYYKTDIDSLTTSKDYFTNNLREIENKIEELDVKIKKNSNNQQNINDHERLRQLEKYEPDLSAQITTNKAELLNLENSVTELNDKLQSAIDKSKAQIKLRNSYELADKAWKRVDSIIDTIKNETRLKISKEMSSIFFNLMWKKEFKAVELTTDYKTSIINSDNLECLGSCSAAERELLVLAFTLALHKQSGFEGPLVIDTPISRISGDLRKSFANVLKKVSENKQIILFMTKDEYSENVRDIFETSANCKFKLTLDHENFVNMEEL